MLSKVRDARCALVHGVHACALPSSHLGDALQRVVEMLGGAAADEYVDAIACQKHGDRAPDPGRAAGDDRLAAVKTRPLGMGILFVDHFELHLSRARFAGRTGACSLSAERRAERRRSSPPIEDRGVFSRLSDAGYETGEIGKAS